MIVRRFSIIFLFLLSLSVDAALLIPMDEKGQRNHLKAYGIAFMALEQGHEIYWLLNYRGGSFLLPETSALSEECVIRGVSYEKISESKVASIFDYISAPAVNMEKVKLEKAPKVAVYSPKTNQPWDDAVTMVLTYAEIPYDVIYDEEVLNDKLVEYDWLHLHHEDFTGQYGKFYTAYRNAPWYIQNKNHAEAEAKRMGFAKVSEQKLAVAKKIKAFTAGGGFLFAMCSATDSYDIALSADGVDICETMFDGDPAEAGYEKKIDFDKTLAFRNYQLSRNPHEYEFSNIDVTSYRKIKEQDDYFLLFEFSAKWDVVPSMLCQNHQQVVKGFMGQTTAFNKDVIKPNVLVMGEAVSGNEARYIHGNLGKGTWTFYGGHDPEDYQHRVGDPKTDLNLHPNSPGYRLILNNILFPAAHKKPQKT